MSLRDLVRDEAIASMSRSDRLTALRSVRLYFQRPDEPGFLVSETEEGPVVPVFTSLERLALFAGVCPWASTTLEDVVELLPEGVRALVDPLGPRTVVLDARSLEDTDEQGPEDAT
ncbi:SseB family protein [Streptomyces sp. 205]|uniref:SseB family protein n=2 Tax=Streptomyces coffeae TaxID=621382 RepID=A0ABS1NPS9_9ACTN|nr:SseB family protein [Streptomyces coffeae]